MVGVFAPATAGASFSFSYKDDKMPIELEGDIDFHRFVLRGSPARVLNALQCVSVIEARMAGMYQVQVEPSVVTHMFLNDFDLESELIEFCMIGCSDEDLWTFEPFKRLYNRVLSHYCLER